MEKRREDFERLIWTKTQEAVALAMASRWEDAVSVNRSLLDMAPDSVDTHNRLGKALLESDDLAGAKASFRRALELASDNGIARKNLVRLETMEPAASAPPGRSQRMSPHLFIEDSGKSTRVGLVAPETAPARLPAAGTSVELRLQGGALAIHDRADRCIGLLPSNVGRRIARLMEGGNRYEAAVCTNGGRELSIVIHEVYQDPTQRHLISFPARVHTTAAQEQPMAPPTDDDSVAALAPASWDAADVQPIAVSSTPADFDDDVELLVPDEFEELDDVGEAND